MFNYERALDLLFRLEEEGTRCSREARHCSHRVRGTFLLSIPKEPELVFPSMMVVLESPTPQDCRSGQVEVSASILPEKCLRCENYLLCYQNTGSGPRCFPGDPQFSPLPSGDEPASRSKPIFSRGELLRNILKNLQIECPPVPPLAKEKRKKPAVFADFAYLAKCFGGRGEMCFPFLAMEIKLRKPQILLVEERLLTQHGESIRGLQKELGELIVIPIPSPLLVLRYSWLGMRDLAKQTLDQLYNRIRNARELLV